MTEPAAEPAPAALGPYASPGYHLLMAAQTWRRELGARLRPLGLTPTQFDVIGALGWTSRSTPDPTQQQVADVAGIDRMMLSKVVVGLERRGILVRLLDPDDARLRRLRLTPEGRELVSRAAALARQVDAELFEPDGRDALTAQLETIVARATGALD